MKPTDRAAFAECMAPFASVYGLQLTTLVLDVWWGALAEYPLEDVRTALALHVKDPEAGMFRPTPAHIINHLARTIPEARRKAQMALRDEYLTARRAIENQQLMLVSDRNHELVPEDEFRRRMAALNRELADLNAIPRFAPLKALLGRGY